ncbi:conserved hypothetical protein [Prochlorococcus marinus subsp. pastoris str. CCMP1986]|uniref:Uncharacterized protein n=1 Tax=Prochlorococcus marinus subsp. pastoris (strain CCMP1986 / NIES-2087 / MED4) TaxID=59919 RepID=Q7V0L8_PROMP|nr:phosphotransferase [Prochlorococcus marinus]KGF87199.1 hypothetical protein PROCH_0786 [Prochlorococcus marinus str. EQPAC1]CAE19697.1 conserved hypothetical protein [Prochlorococcus marinus subsp. pastoris str. CCMP1986]
MKKPLIDIKSLLKSKGISIEDYSEIGFGKNSRSFRVFTKKQIYFFKIYSSDHKDKRDRLLTELNFLNFLKESKFNNTPLPIVWDFKERWILLSWINGERLSNPSNDECQTLVDFLINIQSNRESEFAKKIGNASEAQFSINDHINHVHERFKKVDNYFSINKENNIPKESSFYELEILFNKLFRKFGENIDKSFPFFDSKKDIYKILSPSDVGFHNILIDRKKLYFIDFEYAGWDDPCKLICDLVLQPDYPIPSKYIGTINKLISNKHFPKDSLNNLDLMLNIYQSKWVLIILNTIIFNKDTITENVFKKLSRKISKYIANSEAKIFITKKALFY